MASPTGGRLRILRAASLGVVGFVLALVAHRMAGGAAPGLIVLNLLAGLTGLAALLLTAVRLSPLRIGVSLAAMQVALHEAFQWLGAPAGWAPGAGSATGAMQVGQVGQPALAFGTGMTDPGMGQGPVLGTTAMLGAHVAATVVMAALLANGEKVLWFLARWVRPAPWLRVHVTHRPVAQTVSASTPPRLRVRLSTGGVGRRGPPPQALSAIV
jgi:hypothetical protein